MATSLSDLTARLVAGGLARPDEIAGCSEREIAEITADQGTRLPEAYDAFLRTMGRGAGALMAGTDVYYPAVLGLKEAAQGLLDSRNGPFQLPDTAVVFLMHEGYFFMYFDGALGDDPPVWRYHEAWDSPEQSYDHFLDWLEATVKDHERLYAHRMGR